MGLYYEVIVEAGSSKVIRLQLFELVWPGKEVGLVQQGKQVGRQVVRSFV